MVTPMKSEAGPQNRNVRSPFPTAGDVILCRGGSKSRWNIAAQQMVRWGQRVRHSHVALYINDFVVHAMPDKGVHAIPVTQFFLQIGLRDDWQVFRHAAFNGPDLEQNAINGTEVYSRAQYFVGQFYNHKFLLPKLHKLFGTVDKTAFCSELICYVYEGSPARKTIRRRNAAAVLPADIERAVTSSNEWVDVTWIYRQNVEAARSGGQRIIDLLIDNQLTQAKLFETHAKLLTHFAKQSLDVAAKIEKYTLLKCEMDRLRGLPETPRAQFPSSNLQKISQFNWRIARYAAASQKQVAKFRRKLERQKRQ